MKQKFELNAPAGNPASLKAAVDNGADAVYFGFRTVSNARNYPGLNFDFNEIEKGIRYIHDAGKKAYITVNTYPQKNEIRDCYKAVDDAYSLDSDAIIASDTGIMNYISEKYPDIRVHASVLSRCYNKHAAGFLKRFNCKRVVLPYLLTIDEISDIKKSGIEVEIFAAGRVIGLNREGCLLNSYIAGWPITTKGACTPVEYLRIENDSVKLNNITIDKINKDELLPYPAICMGRYFNKTINKEYRIIRDAESLNILKILPELDKAGVDTLKIEGRQRSGAYISTVTRILREAIDSYNENPGGYTLKESWNKELMLFAEGGCTVSGGFNK